MEFYKATLNQLVALARKDGTYPGGSHQDREGFIKYVRSKTVTLCRDGRRVPARDVFSRCYVFYSENARAAEDRLLRSCVDSCPFNTREYSNLDDEAGYVYVLVP